jgi:hypothetical protein
MLVVVVALLLLMQLLRLYVLLLLQGIEVQWRYLQLLWRLPSLLLDTL